MGVTDPETTFSACFGAAFLVWHPTKYAELLAEKMREHGSSAWLVNTGWSGGAYGVGSRIKLQYTRSIIDAIHDGSLHGPQFKTDPVFGLSYPLACPGLPSEILNPRNTWSDKDAFDSTAAQLAAKFNENFKEYEDQASDAIKSAGPIV